MPDLRVVTWNSTGEADGRGAELVAATQQINTDYATDVPVQLIAIQEANATGGSIQTALTNSAPFNTQFVQPHTLIREHDMAAQTGRVGVSKAYRLSHMATHATVANNLTSVAGPHLVDLRPTSDAGVNTYINSKSFSPRKEVDVREAAKNMRFPVYQRFTYGGGSVHFFTWHVEQRAHWLGATFLTASFEGPALIEAFAFLQQSTFYTNVKNSLTGNDVLIIAGDLNISERDVQGVFSNFVGYSQNLDHILAYSPSMNLDVDQGEDYDESDYGPHNLLTARVRW